MAQTDEQRIHHSSSDRSIAELMRELSEQTSTLVRQEMELARAELTEKGEGLKVVKLNIDENQQTAVKFNVMSIPTLMLFKHGEVAKTVIGAYPKRKIEEELEPALA